MKNNRIFELSSPVVLMSGFAYGLHHMSMRFSMRLDFVASDALRELVIVINSNMEEATVDEGVSLAGFFSAQWLKNFLISIQESAGFRFFDCGYIRESDSEECTLYVPVHRGAFVALTSILQVLVDALNCEYVTGGVEGYYKRFLHAYDVLKRYAPPTGNIRGFVSAAYDLNIPVQRLPGNALMFGQGVLARLLDSSFTDHTSVIASQLARNKPMASELLRIYGLPVQPQKIVIDLNGALKAADAIGYPVVIKPVDRDRGEGVSANLVNPQQLEMAFLKAAKYSKNIIVEKHFYGKDYRLTILNNELIWAVERVPGGVLGNGELSIRELLGVLNSSSERGDSSRHPLKKIELDDEARELLELQGYSLDSIPDQGLFVPLRRISNVTRGGMPVPVLDRVHPDNRRLAERAAKILRLDIAGVDLLIEDITKSWREVGAAICEVNAQPTIGTYTAGHLYAEILRKLINKTGRIPIVITVGADASRNAQLLTRLLMDAGHSVGTYHEGTLFISQDSLEVSISDVFSAGRALIMDQDVSAVVLALTDTSVLQRGLPFDRYDVLVTDCQDHLPDPELLEMITPACDGHIFQIGSAIKIPGPGPSAEVEVSICSTFNPRDVLEQLITRSHS